MFSLITNEIKAKIMIIIPFKYIDIDAKNE